MQNLVTLLMQWQHNTMEIQIKLGNVQVTNLLFEVKTFENEITNNLETELKFSAVFAEDSDTSFAIVFDIFISDENKEFNLQAKITSHFETNVPIDEQFKNSTFVKISAPAIAFPYIRAFISNITLNSGYNPVMLPSFNFIKIAEEQDAEKQKNEM